MKLLCQSYFLCFNDQNASFPHLLYKLFKGEINRTMDSGDFVSSSDNSVLQMKHVILQSLRTAFHYSQEALIMGEFDVPTNHAEFEVIKQCLNKYRMNLLPYKKNGSQQEKTFCGTQLQKRICQIQSVSLRKKVPTSLTDLDLGSQKNQNSM